MPTSSGATPDHYLRERFRLQQPLASPLKKILKMYLKGEKYNAKNTPAETKNVKKIVANRVSSLHYATLSAFKIVGLSLG